VSHCHDRQLGIADEVDDPIGEVTDTLGPHDRVMLPARPYCPRLRCVGTLVNGAKNLNLEPIAQTDLAIVVPVDVSIELSLGLRMPLDIQVSALLPRRLTSCATLRKMSKHLFMGNGLDVAAEDVIDTRRDLVGPCLIDRLLIGDLN